MIKKISLITSITVLIASRLSAGPFININSVDANSEFPRVKINISVVDPGNRGVTGLDEENILVYEDGYRVNYVKVKDISSTSDPLYLVFAIDSSKSISGEYLEKIKRSAGEIADSAGPADKIAVLRFNDSMKFLNNFSSNRMEISSSIKSVERHGSNTVMNDAIYDSIHFLSKVKSSRRGVVVFTDGKDEGSSLKSDDIIAFSREKGIPVYFITSSACKKTASMGRIAKLTGGLLITSAEKSITSIYRIILSRIKNVYEVYYQSIAGSGKGKHLLEVRLKYGDLKDRDIAEFTAGRNLFKVDFPDGSYIILSLLVILLFAILFILMYFFVRKTGEKLVKNKAAKPMKESVIEKDYNRNFYTGEVSVDDLKPVEIFDENVPREVPDILYSQVWLHNRSDHGSGEKFQMIKSEITIGSGRDNAICLDDESVSEKHTRIRRIDGGYYLYDLVSDSGTFLNGRKLLRPKLLHDWDEIGIGNTTLIFRAIR